MISVILCAAGKGERTGFAENKVLKEWNGLPVLSHSLSAFSATEEIGEIVIPCAPKDEKRIGALLAPYPNARTVSGGETRFESVWNALQTVTGEIVLVHDGARPFVTNKTIADCIAAVKEYGSGVCALPATDTTVLAENGTICTALPRASIYTVQTPQGFDTERLKFAYAQARKEGKLFTDESGVYAQYVAPPHLFLGDPHNKKLTFAEDFLPAERVGFGADTHAFGKAQDYLVLGGIKIPAKSGLIAHSDGDVLVHALMDALLSAAGLRDIGCYFPDTDERFAGADSFELLKEVVSLVVQAGFAPKNASISVLAQTPRLFPYIERMKAKVAAALNLPLSAVGIAAGTNEKLGYVGEEKGITVYATVLLQ